MSEPSDDTMQNPASKKPVPQELPPCRPGMKMPLAQIEPVASFLASFSVGNTREAYLKDLHDFFGIGYRAVVSCDVVRSFIFLDEKQAQAQLREYQQRLTEQKSTRGSHDPLTPKTVNRRMTGVRSLLRFSHDTFGTPSSGRRLVKGVQGSTQFVLSKLSPQELERFIEAPAVFYPKRRIRQQRDTAILCLFCENGLRRAEVSALNVGDFLEGDFQGRLLAVRHDVSAKAIENPRPSIETLSLRCAAALEDYLKAARHGKDPNGPLLRNLDRRQARQSAGIRGGNRLSVDGLYALVQEYARKLDLENVSPDRLRQSAPKQPRRMS